MLADKLARTSLDLLTTASRPATLSFVELGPLAVDIAQNVVSGYPTEPLQSGIACSRPRTPSKR